MARPRGNQVANDETNEAEGTVEEQEPVEEPELPYETPEAEFKAKEAQVQVESAQRAEAEAKKSARRKAKEAANAVSVQTLAADHAEVVYESKVPNLRIYIDPGTPGYPDPMNPRRRIGEVKPKLAQFKKVFVMKLGADGNRRLMPIGEFHTSDPEYIEKLDKSDQMAKGGIYRQVNRLDMEIDAETKRLEALKSIRNLRTTNEAKLRAAGIRVTSEGVGIRPGSNAHRGIGTERPNVLHAPIPEMDRDPALEAVR